MDLGLKNKVVVITGGNAGLGKGFVQAFLDEGCRVATCGRSEKANAQLRAEFPDVLALEADMGNPDDISRLAAETEARFGGIDVWINNAGYMPSAPLLEMSEEAWDDIMNVNLKAIFRAAKVVAPYMEKRGGGVIINAASFATLIPSAGTGAYAAAKSAVASLTRVYAAELAPKNIRVVCYIPGMFDTAMTAGGIARNADKLMEPLPLRRFGLPEDIAPAVVFLASEKARYITGTAMEVTGGKFCVQNAEAVWK